MAVLYSNDLHMKFQVTGDLNRQGIWNKKKKKIVLIF